MWLFRKQLADVVACKLEKRVSSKKTTCPREHFHNANSEKQTFKVMSGIHALFIIWRIFIETIWWVIHNNNNKTPLNPGVFRSLQTDNRVEFQQCLPGFEVSVKKWPPALNPSLDPNEILQLQHSPGYTGLCCNAVLDLTRMWQEYFLAFST